MRINTLRLTTISFFSAWKTGMNLSIIFVWKCCFHFRKFSAGSSFCTSNRIMSNAYSVWSTLRHRLAFFNLLHYYKNYQQLWDYFRKQAIKTTTTTEGTWMTSVSNTPYPTYSFASFSVNQELRQSQRNCCAPHPQYSPCVHMLYIPTSVLLLSEYGKSVVNICRFYLSQLSPK